MEFAKLGLFELFTECVDFGEVAGGEVVLFHNGSELVGHICDEFLLFLILPHDGGHLRLKMAYYVGQGFDLSNAFDEFVNFPHSGLTWQDGQISHEIALLLFEQLRIVKGLEGFTPEGPNINAKNLGRVDGLAERPEEGAVDTHELLPINLVRLVENASYLILVALEHVDGRLELIRNVQFMRVKEEDDQVSPVREPRHDLGEIVSAVGALLLPR
mmetsp:Transcript_359/g.703  ORF Transcript_359/g.703 Transcript_359/m.703 type:complete len:215 (-) Transcript_359:45-689(-)